MEIVDRAGRMLIGSRAQFGAAFSGECRQIGGIEIDRMQFVRCVHQDVFGFQVAVRTIVREQFRTQSIECER